MARSETIVYTLLTVYSQDVSEREIGLREARAQLGDLVAKAQYNRKSTIITRNGRPAAMITPVPQHIALRDLIIDFVDQGDWREQAINKWIEAAAEDGYGFIVLATYDEGDVIAVVARDDWSDEGEMEPGERMTLRVDRSSSQVEPGEGDMLGLMPGPYDSEQHPVTSPYPSKTITLISATTGDIMPEGAKELAESGIEWSKLPGEAQAWATEQGYGDSDDEFLYVVRGEVELDGWPTYVVTL